MSLVLRPIARTPAFKASQRLPTTQSSQIHKLNLAQLHDKLHTTQEAPRRLHSLSLTFHKEALTREIHLNRQAREIEFREVHARVRDGAPSPLIARLNEKKPCRIVAGSAIAAAALGTEATLVGKELVGEALAGKESIGRELASQRNFSAADMDCAFDL